MKSKVLIIVIAAVILIGGGFYFFLSSGKKTVSPLSESGPAEENQIPTVASKPAVESLVVWKDPAGFTFKYSKELKANNHPEDKVNFANIDFTAEGKTGGIKILGEETKLTSLEQWLKNDKRVKGGSALDSTLGDKVAKKVSVGSTGNIIIGTLDSDMLLIIELTPDSAGYFKKAFDQIVSSFEFQASNNTSGSSQGSSGSTSGGGEVVEEAEEIIE